MKIQGNEKGVAQRKERTKSSHQWTYRKLGFVGSYSTEESDEGKSGELHCCDTTGLLDQ